MFHGYHKHNLVCLTKCALKGSHHEYSIMPKILLLVAYLMAFLSPGKSQQEFCVVHLEIFYLKKKKKTIKTIVAT